MTCLGSTPIPDHAVLIVGGRPTGLMLAGEVAQARVDVAIVERRPSPQLDGRREGGLHARTIEILDQRGIAERFRLTRDGAGALDGGPWGDRVWRVERACSGRWELPGVGEAPAPT